RVAVAAKGLLKAYKYNDAVEEKGAEARWHVGIIAQDLKAAFEAEGLDAGKYGMFIHSTWTDEETGEERSRMGVRYSELLAFIIAAI
ncbi:MAG: tail fiber domain-containing protein, partial [Candidatus Poseidoniales archaeon]